MSDSGSNSEIVLELAEEFLTRYRKGERPPLREYIERHPELAAEIKDVFPTMAMMENIALADESVQTDMSASAPRAAEPLLQQVGDYRIIREVGRGGMGVVYEAEQVSLGRHVALKVLPQNALLDVKQKRRFQREAKAAAKLHHTNIVPIFAVGEHDGLPFYVMQFIQGLGLDQVMDELKRVRKTNGSPSAGELRVLAKDKPAAEVAQSLLTGQFRASEPSNRTNDSENKPAGAVVDGAATQAHEPGEQGTASAGGSSGRLSDSFTLSSSSVTLPGQSGDATSPAKQHTYWQSVAQIGVQVADALEYAHKQGILHRDIKPSNLLLDTRGTTWVTDFGLAKADDQQNITHTGDILGTLRYMPPEAFEGKTDPRSDVYSLGLTLYEMLALQPAFDEQDRNKLIKQVMNQEPPRLNRLNPTIPRDLVTVVHKAIDREPSHRYASAAELAADLHRFINDEPIQARRLSPRERLWRWGRRNPAVASLTAALVLLMLGVTIASVILAARFDYLAKDADNARQLAVAAQKKTADSLRETDEQRKIAQKSFKALQTQMKERAADRYKIARLAAKDRRPDETIRDLKEVVRFYEWLIDAEPKNAAHHRGLAEAALDLGELHWNLAAIGVVAEQGGRLKDAVANWHKVLDNLQTALRIDPKDAKARKQLAAALPVIAASYGRMGLWEEAARHYREWLSIASDSERRGVLRGEPAVHFASAVTAAADLESHRKACAEVARYVADRKKDATLLHYAWMWTLPKDSPGDPALAVEWALPGLQNHNGWAEFVLGLAQHRAGRPKLAILAAEKSLATEKALTRPWPGVIMNYPVLAMAHHQLGHAADADLWLRKARAEWHRLSPLQSSIASPTVLPSARPNTYWFNFWHVWPTFDLLYREAALQITGTPPIEKALDELHRGYLWTQLGQPQKAEALFAQAIKTRPDDIQVCLARSRLFTALGMQDRAEADAAQITRMQPNKPHAWIGYARSLRERGKHAEADAELRKASELGAYLQTFLEDGWWVTGPYSVDLRRQVGLEKYADPSESPPRTDNKFPDNKIPNIEPPNWRFASPNEEGVVDLRAIYDSDDISAYALNYLHSPTQRTATLLVDQDDWMRLWVNGELVYAYETGAGHPVGHVPLQRVPIALRPGRNTLLVKVNNFFRGHGFIVRVADNPFDQARTFADLGLWKETAELWAKHRNLPDEPIDAFLFAYACLRAKDRKGYREVSEQMLDRGFAAVKNAHPLNWAARACILAPHAVADLRRPIEAAERADKMYRNHAGIQFTRGAACFRDNRLNDAISLCKGGGPPSEELLHWLLRALAHHARGDLEEAKAWRNKAEKRFAKQYSEISWNRTSAGKFETVPENGLIAEVLRRELAERFGDTVEDIEGKHEQARRAALPRRDSPTYDYDLALLLQPDEPRLLLARSRRLAELKRDKEAEADMRRYFALRPNDFNFWALQAQHSAGLGDWKLARGCLDKAATDVRGNFGQTGFEMACIRLLTGDQEGYKYCCKELMADKQAKLPVNRYFVARTVTLTDHPRAEIEAVIPSVFDPDVSKEIFHPRMLLQSGALLCRAGWYKEAAEPLKRCAEKHPNWPGRVVNYLWLALVSYKAEDNKEAKQWLGEAEKWFAQYPSGMPLGTGPGQPETMELHDWLEAHVLYREAKKTIRPK